MTVEQHLRYVSSFYENWDRDLEDRLVSELELARKTRVAVLSTGNAQKLAVVLSVCHHPQLLLLDEPVSSMDPIARETFLLFLVELLNEDRSTIIISSHILCDIEKIVDWIICLDRGRVMENQSLDDLQERFSEWKVTSPEQLPERFEEPFVIEQTVTAN